MNRAIPDCGIELPISKYPAINRFVLDRLEGDPRALSMFRPSRGDGLANRDALAEALIEQNAGWGNDVAATVERWRDRQAVAIVAGQQVGFAGGPLYTLAKIATLLRLRETMRSDGVDATIFFWMATEDHDFDEVADLTWQAKGENRRIRCTATTAIPVGEIEIPGALVDDFIEVSGMEDASWLHQGITFRESFALLLTEVLRDRDVVLVDSLLPELRRAGAPILRDLLERLDEANRLLGERSDEIEREGWKPQLVPRDGGGFALLYLIDDDRMRRPIDAAGIGEALDRLARAAETISTGAATRPLLQDWLFEPAAFVGGPAEVAYYAQVSSLHAAFGVPMPEVMLRGHALVAPERHLRIAESIALEPEEMFDDVDAILARRDESLLDDIDEARRTLEADLERDVARIRDLAIGVDTTLDRSMQRSLRKLRHQTSKLGERAKRAALRRDQERHRALTRLHDTLAPNGVPQDRVAGWIGYWLQYGPRLVDRLADATEANGTTVRVVSL